MYEQIVGVFHKINQDKAIYLTPFLSLILCTFLLLLCSPDRSIYATPALVALCVVVSIALGITTRFFLKYGPYECGMTLLLFFLTSIIGAILMGRGFLFVVAAPQGKWDTLPSLPEKAEKLLPSSRVGFHWVSVFIKSQTETEFQYNCSNDSVCAWEEIEPKSSALDFQNDNLWCLKDQKNIKTPPVFDRVSQTIFACGGEAEWVAHMKVDLLDDGRILLWYDDNLGFDNIYNILLFALFGVLAAFSTSIAALVLRFKRN
jgi:hypothetical protein